MRNLKVLDNIGNETSFFAYEELGYYMKRLFGVSLIRTDSHLEADINLELLSDSINGNDHIYVMLYNGIATIKGNNNISLLIAMYRLFSELGIRFCRPGRDHEYIPSLDIEQWEKSEIMIDEIAAYQHRGVCIEGADS